MTYPDNSVNPRDNFDAAEGYQVMIRTLPAILSALNEQVQLQQRQLQMQSTYAMGGGRSSHGGGALGSAAGLPQVRQDVIRSLARSGGLSQEHMVAGMTQITPTGALSSLQNLQAFAAQRLGQYIAGEPLFDQRGRGGGQGMPAGSAPPGQTVTGPGGTIGAQGPPGFDPFARTYIGPGGPPAGVGVMGSTTSAAAIFAAAAGAASAASTAGASAGTAVAPGVPGGGVPSGGPGGMARALGYRVAVSGGTAGGLLHSLRRLPGIGVATDIGEKLSDFYVSQRESGRRFQEVEGGTNLEGQAERWHQMAYQFSMFGRMPEGAAAAAFNAVTDLGYNRMASGQAGQLQNRQSALNFIYHNYTARGMSVQDSTDVLETASKSTVLSLNQVSDALMQVSNTAGKAGDNAQQMRMVFNEYLGTAISQGAAGGSAALAGALTSMQSAYGQPFASANFGGELSQNMMYLLSGQYGITPSQAQYIMRAYPQQYSNMLTGHNESVISSYINPAELADLRTMISEAGGGQAMTPAIMQQIANQFLNKWQATDPSLNTQVLAQVISQQTGAPVNAGNVMQWIVGQAAGVTEASAARAGTKAGTSVSARNTGSAPQGRYGLALSGGNKQIGTSHAGYTSPPVSWQSVLTSGGASQAASYYLQEESKSGMRSPVLEGLLQNVSQSDQVLVQTRTGPRMVSFADAMRYYPGELASGNVQFYDSSGRSLGGTGSFTQGLTDPSAPWAAEQRQKGAGSRAGTSYSAWRKQHPAPASGSGGNVTVTLTQEAQQLLRLLPGNNDQAAAQGMVPVNPYVTQGSR